MYLVSTGPSPESWQRNPSRWKMETTGGGEADEPGVEFCFSVSCLASSLGVTFIIHKTESVFPVLRVVNVSPFLRFSMCQSPAKHFTCTVSSSIQQPFEVVKLELDMRPPDSRAYGSEGLCAEGFAGLEKCLPSSRL